jgi:ubiquinone/menaquinone biosynthesis C-methylase UbiE
MKMEHRHIIEQVPTDYYQKGIESNILQRIWHMNKLRVVTELIPIEPKKILDVGCASGWFLSELLKIFPKAEGFGIDIYGKAIAYGKKSYPSITFASADAHKIPFRSKMFDLVICTEVLEHVDDPKSVLLEIKRVLKKDGFAIVELDSGSLLFSIVWFIWKKFQGSVWSHAHLHSFTSKELEKIVLGSSFQIVKTKKFNMGMAIVFLLQNE